MHEEPIPRARSLRSRADRSERGASLVEFAIVVPVALVLIFGLIGVSYMAFQSSALSDGASAGARMASIETSLVQANGGQYCESGSPESVETAVQDATPLLTVNMEPLCAASATATELTQSSDPTGDVNITVTCGGSCADPTTTQVYLWINAASVLPEVGLFTAFDGPFTLSSQSQVPVLSP